MDVAYEKQTLDNGLDVVVHEDHECPIVAVNVWYHVGSKNERPDRTGFAHLFEHLMFEGSAHHDSGYFRPLQEIGAELNGSTNTDRTNYWEVVSTSALERALWMESDRMGFLLSALTKKKFETQRDVVLNERRQNYENRPYGLVPVALTAAIFPPLHPYHWPTIGHPKHLRAATLDEVRQFFSTFYHPANASLAIAGDVEAARAFDLVNSNFGEIPARPRPPKPEVISQSDRPLTQFLLLRDGVELPRLYLTWRTPALFSVGDAELDLLAQILAGGKSSRLYRELVYERRVATDVSAGQGSRELEGTFGIVATAAPGHTLSELDELISAALTQISVDGPTDDELERARARMEADFVYGWQTMGGFGGLSDQLNAYNVLADDPGFFSADLERFANVTPAAIGAATRSYLSIRGRVALSVLPHDSDVGMAIHDSVLVEPS